ncbi:hypothetical protein GEMRC1_012040 [Eukaryota sp. GEM-RC1]
MSLSSVVLHGFLKLKDGFFGTYSRRFFRLEGYCLNYYSSSTAEDDPIGSIPLLNSTFSRNGDRFEIAVPHKTFHLLARTPSESASWIRALKRAQSLLKEEAAAQNNSDPTKSGIADEELLRLSEPIQRPPSPVLSYQSTSGSFDSLTSSFTRSYGELTPLNGSYAKPLDSVEDQAVSPKESSRPIEVPVEKPTQDKVKTSPTASKPVEIPVENPVQSQTQIPKESSRPIEIPVEKTTQDKVKTPRTASKPVEIPVENPVQSQTQIPKESSRPIEIPVEKTTQDKVKTSPTASKPVEIPVENPVQSQTQIPKESSRPIEIPVEKTTQDKVKSPRTASKPVEIPVENPVQSQTQIPKESSRPIEIPVEKTTQDKVKSPRTASKPVEIPVENPVQSQTQIPKESSRPIEIPVEKTTQDKVKTPRTASKPVEIPVENPVQSHSQIPKESSRPIEIPVEKPTQDKVKTSRTASKPVEIPVENPVQSQTQIPKESSRLVELPVAKPTQENVKTSRTASKPVEIPVAKPVQSQTQIPKESSRLVELPVAKPTQDKVKISRTASKPVEIPVAKAIQSQTQIPKESSKPIQIPVETPKIGSQSHSIKTDNPSKPRVTTAPIEPAAKKPLRKTTSIEPTRTQRSHRHRVEIIEDSQDTGIVIDLVDPADVTGFFSSKRGRKGTLPNAISTVRVSDIELVPTRHGWQLAPDCKPLLNVSRFPVCRRAAATVVTVPQEPTCGVPLMLRRDPVSLMWEVYSEKNRNPSKIETSLQEAQNSLISQKKSSPSRLSLSPQPSSEPDQSAYELLQKVAELHSVQGLPNSSSARWPSRGLTRYLIRLYSYCMVRCQLESKGKVC